MTTSQNAPVTLVDGLSRGFLLHHRMCPRTLRADGKLAVAVGPNHLVDGLDDLSMAYRAEVVVENMEAPELEQLIERLTTQTERHIEMARGSADSGDDDQTADVRDLANQPPVVRYVNLLVREAFDSQASDIHLEASRTGLTARFRLDGVLAPAPEPPARLHHAVISRIKLLADLDISERRRPQDGRIRVRLESRELDLRVSTVPTNHGESVVLRLLDRGGRPVSLRELGMEPEILAGMSQCAGRPHGMVIVSGPTGSGKTTTLYAALQLRAAGAEKIITVEDPIEYQLAEIVQVPVQRQAGVTFSSVLRAILRQDPDVIMVGEMRDGETAEIATQAAMTGHLVLTTLHTNDAVAAVPRLLDLGVPEYLVAATVEGVLAQRLVRRLCPDCRVIYAPSHDLLTAIGCATRSETDFWRGAGCPSCRGTGFRGRLGIFELMMMTDDLRDAISRRAPRSEMRELALAGGMVPLRMDGWNKAVAGLTTIEEVLRVVQD